MPDQTRNLNSVTDFTGTLDSNDRIIMTDNKASLKALTTAILGKAIIEGYTGSSLAGSSQSVKSAIDALNSNSWSLSEGTAIPENADINTYFTPGNYGVSSSGFARTMTGLPFEKGSTSNYAFNLKVENAAFNDPNTRRQTLQFFNDWQRWIRYGNLNGTWSDWKHEPSRAEVDALINKTTLDTYSSNGLIIYRVGRTAQLAALPSVSTTAQSAVVATIPSGAFRPSSRVWFATKVFDGSSYVDCYIELATNGEISIKSNTGAVVAGYQAQYTQCLGLNFLCTGN